MQPRGGCAVIVEAMQIVLEMLRVTIDGEAVEHVTTAEVASREALLLSTVIPALDLGLTTAYAGADEVDRLALAKREAPIVDATGLSAVAQDRRLLPSATMCVGCRSPLRRANKASLPSSWATRRPDFASSMPQCCRRRGATH